MRLDLATVLRATRASVCANNPDGTASDGGLSTRQLSQPFTSLSIDSRSVEEGELFVALPGERTNGHAYVSEAFNKGARGAIVREVPSNAQKLADQEEEKFLIVVPDPLSALQELAGYWRHQHDVQVIGITGSIGKTTTKEILAEVIAKQGPVLKSQANMNTEIGVPLSLLQIRREHRIAVIEMGMYVPGDVELLTRMAHPQIGVVTNVAPVHLSRVGTIEQIARAKSELVANLGTDALAILNGDDPWTRAMAKASGICKVALTGFSKECDYRAVEARSRALEGISFTLVTNGEEVPLDSPIPGLHHVQAILMATAAARRLGMDWKDIREAVSTTRLDARQRILEGPHESVIIDDSYNAAPQSVIAALSLLADGPGLKIAVLGDMLELGNLEETSHRQVGERVAETVDWLVVRGQRSHWIADEAQRKGLSSARVAKATTNAQAVDIVRDIVRKAPNGQPPPRSTVLIKGSRGMQMEEVVQGLRGLA